MTFYLRPSGYEAVDEALVNAKRSLDEQAAAARERNAGALEGASGQGADAATKAFVPVAAALGALSEGLGRLQGATSSAHGELSGNLTMDRDELYGHTDSLPSDVDRIWCDPSADVGGAARDAHAALTDLSGRVRAAREAVGALDNGAGERDEMSRHLEDCASHVSWQLGEVESLLGAWTAFSRDLSDFDSRYSAAFSRPLVDEGMLERGCFHAYDVAVTSDNGASTATDAGHAATYAGAGARNVQAVGEAATRPDVKPFLSEGGTAVADDALRLGKRAYKGTSYLGIGIAAGGVLVSSFNAADASARAGGDGASQGAAVVSEASWDGVWAAASYGASTVGGDLGANAGATVGAVIGSFLCPGAGTAVGAMLGAGFGAVAGVLAGGYVAETAANSEPVKGAKRGWQGWVDDRFHGR